MVTGEFYGRVTIRWVTTRPARLKPLRDKRPACRRLRSSSYNFPDQRDAVMKSLSKNFVFSATVDGTENAARQQTHRPKVSTRVPRVREMVCWQLLLIGKFWLRDYGAGLRRARRRCPRATFAAAYLDRDGWGSPDGRTAPARPTALPEARPIPPCRAHSTAVDVGVTPARRQPDADSRSRAHDTSRAPHQSRADRHRRTHRPVRRSMCRDEAWLPAAFDARHTGFPADPVSASVTAVTNRLSRARCR